MVGDPSRSRKCIPLASALSCPVRFLQPSLPLAFTSHDCHHTGTDASFTTTTTNTNTTITLSRPPIHPLPHLQPPPHPPPLLISSFTSSSLHYTFYHYIFHHTASIGSNILPFLTPTLHHILYHHHMQPPSPLTSSNSATCFTICILRQPPSVSCHG
ncbi:hypothetical protein E2C01_008539 [Portunus trituberculatus]|uniref:Uncharacterized protein n=1 Tax=Portunus trituberculatus TaxID=210409 RepID=A0A5B7D2M9_PORTR|nr:hypothetical protein [Portunus trituberculatus]